MLSHLKNLKQCYRFSPVISKNVVLLSNERMIKFTTQKAYIYRGVGNKLPKEFEDKWLKYDNIPPGYELIYKGQMDKYLTALIGVNTPLMLSVFGIVFYRIFILKEPLYEVGEYYGNKNFAIATSDVEIGMVAIMYMILCGCCSVVIDRTVLRIYNRDDDYIAIFPRYIPKLTKQLYFHMDDVDYIETKVVPKLFQSSAFSFKNKKVFLMEDNFRSARDQIKLTKIWGDI